MWQTQQLEKKKEADDQEKKKLNNVAHGLLSTPFVSYIQYINHFSYVYCQLSRWRQL